jgi:hypothetical protein
MRNASSDAEVRTHMHAACAAVCDARVCTQAMQQLLQDTGADGYNGDTMVTPCISLPLYPCPLPA